MTQESANRVPELDGVRGLAILMVLFFHILTVATPITGNAFLVFLTKLVGIGWMGVDIFFVLSGFLITSILLNTRNKPHYFKNFYARRILRIFPLYFLIIGGILLLLPVLTPKTASSDQASWPYFVFYLQNWLVIPSLHLGTYSLYIGPSWSLAIEEQFYLIWPALVFFLSQRRQVFVSVAVLIISLILRLVFVELIGYSDEYLPHFLYFGSLTRFDGFAVGALIAIAFQSEHWKGIFSRFAWPALIASLAGIAAILIQSGNASPLNKNYYLNTWGYSLIVLAAGAFVVVITTSPKQAILPSFFRNPVFLFFGKYSYAMYLIHYPIMLFLFYKMDYAHAKGGKNWLIFVGLTFILTILGSLLTWHVLEKQMLKLKKYFEYQSADASMEMGKAESSE